MDNAQLNQTLSNILSNLYLHHHHGFESHFMVVAIYLKIIILNPLVYYSLIIIVPIVLILNSRHQISFCHPRISHLHDCV